MQEEELILGEETEREEEVQQLIEEIRADPDWDRWKDILQQKPPVEVAEILQSLPEHLFFDFFERFSLEQQALIFNDLDRDYQKKLLLHLGPRRFAKIFELADSAERVDFFQDLTPEEQSLLLPYLSKQVREEVIKLSAYPEDTAGGIMSTDFATLYEGMTAQEALEKVRRDAPRKMIYYTYVVDDDQKLKGVLTLRKLVLANPDQKIDDIMLKDFVYAHVNEDREEVVNKIEKYDLIAIPVVNDLGQLVGIVTYDEAMDVLREEQTEDLEKMMGIVPEETFEYKELSIWDHYRRRVVWLVILALMAMGTATVIRYFEGIIAKVAALAFFLPLVTGMGGNSGSQAAAQIIRALALGQVTVSDWLKIVWNEARVGIILGITLGLLGMGEVFLVVDPAHLGPGFELVKIAWVVGISLAVQIVFATLMGSLIPLVIHALGKDPALASSPFLATLVDITGVAIYFSVAMWLLDISPTR